MQAPIQEPGPIEKALAGSFVKTFLFRRRHDRPRDIPPHLGARRFTTVGNAGAKIVGHTYPAPHGHPKGVVVLAHPDKRYAQHWFVREGWIEWLHEHGYTAVTFDFSRYGASRGGSTYLHDDVIAVTRHAHATHPGTPVHVIGLSIGAFALANAAPRLDFVQSLTLESPYPGFGDWYAHNGASTWLLGGNRAFHSVFPRTAARIDAPANLGRAAAPHILVVAMKDDTITPTHLSRRVAAAGPADRTRYLELDGPAHLDAFRERSDYRAALLDHFAGRHVGTAPPDDVVPLGPAAPMRRATSRVLVRGTDHASGVSTR